MQFGKWAFAGIVVILGYEVLDTWAPQYRNMYLAALLLSIFLFYFGAGGARNTNAPQPRLGRGPF